jgi:hypothetical protein
LLSRATGACGVEPHAEITNTTAIKDKDFKFISQFTLVLYYITEASIDNRKSSLNQFVLPGSKQKK